MGDLSGRSIHCYMYLANGVSISEKILRHIKKSRLEWTRFWTSRINESEKERDKFKKHFEKKETW